MDAVDLEKAFGFHPVLANWFAHRFCEPSPPQTQGWPIITAGAHALILAPTGSGKTLAAFYGCLDALFRKGLAADHKAFSRNAEGVHTLYISPLKALNNDIHRNLQEPLEGICQTARDLGMTAPDIRVAVRTGDTSASARQSMLKKPPHILITTPESLYLLLTSGRGRGLFQHLRYVLLDEIHALSNNKRGVHLSLSLERLMELCAQEPVRIGLSATQKPLSRIAAFLGGQQVDAATGVLHPRPVRIVDTGQRKQMHLSVVSPVENFSELPDASVWPSVYQKLYELICSHRSTLVFVNMRAQTEKIARILNEMHRQAGADGRAELALAHHGSISRETRHDIEARLKAGEIPAVIATSSLELGIDIGSIDLVVQLESPKSVASALQRVGRSGHLLQATSKGVLIPLYAADLDDAMTVVHAMQHGEIEETVVPENCLDVLAQQIVAEVALRDWQRIDLYRLVRRSYCYRTLSEHIFDQVLAMLSGDSRGVLQALHPRISWDKINDRLIGRRGSRLLAVMNAGTIPDRAYYAVYLTDGKTRLGEVEEEFVFESRVGDHFFLGNNEWRVASIDRNQILVTSVDAIKPRAPFWKGELLFRDTSTSQRIGALRREIETRLPAGNARSWLESYCHADRASAENLVRYLKRQIAHTGMLPTDQVFVAEQFIDAVGQAHFVLHAPLGARVNGLWALALAAMLEKQQEMEIQYAYDDDCLVIRVPEIMQPEQIQRLLRLEDFASDAHIATAMMASPVYSVRFRHNAARSLMLPRSRPNKRIPLWLQRLRSADLMQAIRELPDFPLAAETLRDCLKDVFDLPSLRLVLQRIESELIRVHMVQTASPSPMASTILFRFLAMQMYQEDRFRLPGQAANVSSSILTELLNRGEIPALVTAAVVQEAEQRWQHLSPDFQVRDTEDLHALLCVLGPLPTPALLQRCAADPSPWLQSLGAQGRIRALPRAGEGWVVTEQYDLWQPPLTAEKAGSRIRQYLAGHGPVTVAQIGAATGVPPGLVQEQLEILVEKKVVVHGTLLIDGSEPLWCDREHFAELYRRAVTLRRKLERPAQRSEYYRFLMHWHHFDADVAQLEPILSSFRGLRMSIYAFERDFLPARAGIALRSAKILAGLAEQMASGAWLPHAFKDGEGRTQIHFLPRGEGHVYHDRMEYDRRLAERDPAGQQVWQFLCENGASFFQDILRGTRLETLHVHRALYGLACAGLVSCDQYDAFIRTLQGEDLRDRLTPSVTPAASSGRLARHGAHQRIRKRLLSREGRWLLTSAFAAFGHEIGLDAKAEKQAMVLLQRYGIVVKEWARREQGLLPWPYIFHALKRLEWQGRIRRGYFIQGLSGIQFALPEAFQVLDRIKTAPAEPLKKIRLISTMDPAIPFGGAVSWEMMSSEQTMEIVRKPGYYIAFHDFTPVAYLENYGRRIRTFSDFSPGDAALLAQAMKIWLRLPQPFRPKHRIEIEEMDGLPAAQSPLAHIFQSEGFELDINKLILWPSAVS